MTKLMKEILAKTRAVPLSTDQSINHDRNPAHSNEYAPKANPSFANKVNAEDPQNTRKDESLAMGFLHLIQGPQG